jgi:hypothetical protein
MRTDDLLNQVLRRLIVQSFPRLRTKTISIRWGAEEDLLYYTTRGDEHTISVGECLKFARRRALEAGIVHELCHIDADLRLGAYQRRLAWDRYARSRWYRIREERAIETRVIELGYASHLLELIRFTHRLGYTFDREHGLSYAEVLRASLYQSP